MPKNLGPAVEEGRGDGVSAADFAIMAARRNSLAVADMTTLGPIGDHTTHPAQCAWHNGRVYRYGSTPDGARHYCRSCVSVIMGIIRKGQ